MEADLRVMQDLKNQIERGRSNFKKSPKERITESYVIARLEGLEEIIKRFSSKHESIIANYEREDLETSYIKSDLFNLGYETYLAYKSELKALLSSPSRFSAIFDASTSNAPKDSIVRLPKISIPVFSGNYAEWTSFKDLFVSLVHNNSALDDVRRLHYLKTQLRGEAEQLIKHIPITHANYSKCWDLLSNRYNNKRFMANCILKRLFGQRVMTSESSTSLKDLLDTTSDCMHELANLGIQVESWDIIIIYIVGLKLDVETRKQWELHVNSLSEELPTFNHLREFLECRFRALEFVEPVKFKSKTTPTIHNNSKSLHTISDVTCPYCAENHRLFSCTKFTNEDVSRRQDIVKSLGLCFNCLGVNHTEKTCRVPTTCHICRKRHHTLLHENATLYTVAVATEATETYEDDEQTQESEVNSTNEANNIASHFAMGQIRRQTLLPTALIKVKSQNSHAHHILRALLDQGSQASFISEASVQLLRLEKIPEKSRVSGLGKGRDIISKHVVMINMQSLHDPAFELQIKAHILNNITSVLPEKKFVLPHWAELNEVVVADPKYNAPNKIDILLGAEVYCSILKQGLIKHPKRSIIAQDTYLGWVVSGQVDSGESKNRRCHKHKRISNMHVTLESEPNWTSEKMTSLCPAKQTSETQLNTTTSRDQSSHDLLANPFLNTISIGRFRCKGRINRVALSASYHNTLLYYLLFFLYLFCLLTLDVSLNESLMIKTTLNPEFRQSCRIMRWHLHPLYFPTDINTMYRPLKVVDKGFDYDMVVWRANNDFKVKGYKILKIVFRIAGAPYLAVKARQQIATDEGSNFTQAAFDYQSETKAIDIREQLNSLLQRGGFILQRVASNRADLKESLNRSNTQLLRLTWNRRSDEFDYTVKLLDEPSAPETKTEITVKILIVKLTYP